MAQNLEIDGFKTKVQFSDYHRRGQQIVGDVPDYDLTSQNCSTLFVAFSVGTLLPKQELFELIFSPYGKIRAIWMKQTDAHTKYRPHAFIDYYTAENA